MSLGLDKWAVLEMKRERKVSNTGIKFQDDQHIGDVDIGRYKYLGILQLEQILNTRIKDNITQYIRRHQCIKENISEFIRQKYIRQEYIKRVKKLCQSKLNVGNLKNGLNAWGRGVVRYSAGTVDSTKEELLNIDKKTKKIMAMNGWMYTKNNVARLYLTRRKGEET